MTIAMLRTGLLGRALAERLQSVGYTVTIDSRTATKALSSKPAASHRDHATGVGDGPSRLCSPHVGLCGDDPCRPADGQFDRVSRSYCKPPALGNLAETHAGTIFVMVGGTEDPFVQWGSAFPFAESETASAGPVEKAWSLKLALNQLFAAEKSAFALSLRLV